MLSYLEYLQQQVAVPYGQVIFLVVAFIIMQVVGELLEFKGKIVPEFMKIRKRFERKRQEKEQIAKVSKQLEENAVLFKEVSSHYDKDSIQKRNKWMHGVDEDRDRLHVFEEILLKVRHEVLLMRIEGMRREIILFASRVADENCFVTREEYSRIFRIYEEYEKTLAENEMENGEIDTNYRIIKKSYEKRLLNHTFLEDLRDL